MKRLTLEQRYKIETLRQEDYSQTKIANILGKDRSVISRELNRNSDQRSHQYKAELAQKKSETRDRKRPKKIYFIPSIAKYVKDFIEKDYSPEQIAGIAKKEGISCVSHERIYQFIWHDKKQGGDLYSHLRTQGKCYRKRGSAKDKRGQIVGRIDIENRPKIVEDKSRFGDLEIDLVIGSNHQGALLTINDRATGMLKMKKIDNKEAMSVEAAAIEILQDWKPFMHTITSDNGKEFAYHQEIAKALEIDYYFAKPYHSWERGANENLNGLIRQYFPKKYDFTSITNQEVTEIENKLNTRPRKRFGFQTPNEVFSQAISNKGIVALVT
jgi:IS30 family transposase